MKKISELNVKLINQIINGAPMHSSSDPRNSRDFSWIFKLKRIFIYLITLTIIGLIAGLASPLVLGYVDTPEWTPAEIELPDEISTRISQTNILSDSSLDESLNTIRGWTTIFSDDFEGTFPGSWDVFDNKEEYGDYFWGKRDCRPYDGSFSAWAVGAGVDGSKLQCESNYPDNAYSLMIYGPFSLEDATDAEFSFMYWLDSEIDNDWFNASASIDGSYFYGVSTSGNSGGWSEYVFDLTDVYEIGDLSGQPEVWIAFVFESNSSINKAQGVFVDNFVLRKYISDTYTISASSGANGDIWPSGDVQVIEGEDQTFYMIPEVGCLIANVEVDGSSVGAVTQYTFTNVQSNHTIHADFAVPLDVFLPLILNKFPPPPPDVPVLNEINNPDGENDYTVSWSSTANATSYILQEDDNDNFSSPTTVYEGPNTSKAMTGKEVGNYFYRVRAENSAGQSDWSNIQSVAVTVPLEPEEWKIISPLGGAYTASLDLDSDGKPHISYVKGSSVYYEYWDGNDWEKQKIEDDSGSLLDRSTSLAIGKNDQPQIVYNRFTNMWGEHITHKEWVGSMWQTTYLRDMTFTGFTNIALKSNDDPCISYYDWGDIYYTCRTGESWSSARHIAQVPLGERETYYHSLAVADDDTPHISYCYYGSKLGYFTLVDGSKEWTIVDGQGTGMYSSIALDSHNHPHISYHDFENGNLKYARWDGSQWQIETVDSVGITGQFTSLALDVQDYPHISYIDATNDDLKYAYWDGSQWQIETIDDSCTVYPYTSLALDDSGYAHIIYGKPTIYLSYATNSDFPGE